MIKEEQIAIITQIMRDADRQFESTGGSTRHYVRDLFLPMLEKSGLYISNQSNDQEMVEFSEWIGKHDIKFVNEKWFSFTFKELPDWITTAELLKLFRERNKKSPL